MGFTAKLIIAILVCYGIYNGFMAARSYMTVSSVLDQVIAERVPAIPDQIRQRIIQKAADEGVPLEWKKVSVDEREAAIAIRVVWSWPIFEYEGQEVLAIPLAIDRTAARPRRL